VGPRGTLLAVSNKHTRSPRLPWGMLCAVPSCTHDKGGSQLQAHSPGCHRCLRAADKWDPDSQAHSPYVHSQFTLFATGLIEARRDRGLGACLVDANNHSKTPLTASACTYSIE
jgi:hypothetical protein